MPRADWIHEPEETLRQFALKFPEATEDHPWDHIAIKVKINGKGPYRVIFDTGAPVSIINRKTAKDAGIVPKNSSASLFGMMAGSPQTTVPSLKVGELEAKDVPVRVLVVAELFPRSLKFAVLLPEPPLMVRRAAIPDSWPLFVGASEETLIVSLAPPVLTLVGAPMVFTLTVSPLAPLLRVVVVPGAVLPMVKVLPPLPSDTFKAASAE